MLSIILVSILVASAPVQPSPAPVLLTKAAFYASNVCYRLTGSGMKSLPNGGGRCTYQCGSPPKATYATKDVPKGGTCPESIPKP